MDGFFVRYTTTFETYATAAEARARCEELRDLINDDHTTRRAQTPGVPWAAGTDQLCWGTITQGLTRTDTAASLANV
jgi:hypothetical protein